MTKEELNIGDIVTLNRAVRSEFEGRIYKVGRIDDDTTPVRLDQMTEEGKLIWFFESELDAIEVLVSYEELQGLRNQVLDVEKVESVSI